jgi:hypothetical protein
MFTELTFHDQRNGWMIRVDLEARRADAVLARTASPRRPKQPRRIT